MVLVKAIPHAGARQGETVCCAGVTERGDWRRQYPVHFRRLADQFGRWTWIEYDWISPKTADMRWESRRVQEDTISVGDKMARSERARFLNPLILPSMEAAKEMGRSLTLIRPRKARFRHKAKTAAQIAAAFSPAADVATTLPVPANSLPHHRRLSRTRRSSRPIAARRVPAAVAT